MNTFRLIESGPSDAATNMAVDEAILDRYHEGVSIPTLRLYGWSPASFSIGVSQKTSELNLKGPFVRRPTGGGALFHDQELTYSFVASCRDLGLSSNVKGTYVAVTSFLIKSYALLGLAAEFADKACITGRIDRHAIEPYCLSRQEDLDILVNGRKIGGNAQKRKKNIFLQHGSIPLGPLSAAAKKNIDFQGLSKILVQGFTRHFNMVLAKGELTPQEAARARQLKIEKYADDGWNRHGKTNGLKALLA